jgi:hypothetical protein
MAMGEKKTGLLDVPIELEEPVNVGPSRLVLESETVVDFATVKTTPKTPSWQPHWGTIAQWIGAVTAVLALVLTLYFHYAAAASSSADEHVNTLIDTKMAKAMDKLDAITSRLDKFEGWREGLEARSKLQLQGIRAKIHGAETSNVSLSPSQLNDYKNTIRAIPLSSGDYWQTVAAIINYESLINQRNGGAPDPAKVSKPCFGLTSDEGHIGKNNSFIGGNYSNCIVDLDTQSFQSVTLQNCVIRYHGGPIALANVRFINCRFILEVAAQPATSAQEKLLLALLDSPDQKIVQVPN